MRILVLNYEFPPVGGGGGRAAAALCASLANRGHQIKVVTSRASGLPREENRNGFNITRVPTGRRSRYQASFASMTGYVLGGLLPAWRIARSWRPDIIHAHFAVPTGALALRLSKIADLPYVLTAHLGDVPGGVPEKTDRWFRYVFPFTPAIWRNAAKVIAVSEYTRELALQHDPVDVSVVPNGIEVQTGDPAEVSRPPRLIFAGRFQPQKNLTMLVEVLARAQDVPWKCELIGDGPTRPSISKLVTERKLQSRIEMPGWVDGKVVDQRLQISDLLLLPSLSEGLPVIGVQALASGVAILASRAGGITELVDDKVNGRLCEANDLDSFEHALRWCLEDGTRLLQMKHASRKRAQRFDIRLIAEQYEAVFNEVVRDGV